MVAHLVHHGHIREVPSPLRGLQHRILCFCPLNYPLASPHDTAHDQVAWASLSAGPWSAARTLGRLKTTSIAEAALA
eukprot:CAMPEP_0116965114 /NCGR_PEP_ID=MMETSP0467-20121206/49009_1 /TAXON_ID=283647 /ORGANISM="Mesodinium pulex, Strain SPMC105" /LENGTH=76 /DNA_ID=CAMNT_0004654263 /DNA_START=320 /DNA_END=546 /DNA_ORIENTATION=+